jgi:hypothetical protein
LSALTVLTALFLLVTADLIERLDDEFGNQCGLLVGREVARAGKGDHAYPGTRLKCAPFIVGDPAITAFAMDYPGWHVGLAEP